MKKIVIILLLSMVNCQWSIAQIGTWKAYMAYHDIQQIQKAGDELFVMASNSLYQYNLTDQSIYTYDKTNGMSDTHITHIAWSSAAGRLIVVYQNSNIDLIEPDGNVINISDLYLKVITGDKTVSSVRIDGVYAYLICGFGIVKVNMERAEIADSYMPNHPEYPTNLPDENNSDYNQYIDVVSKLQPGGPNYNEFYESKFINGKLYTTGGAFLSGRIAKNNIGIIQIYDGNNWILYPTNLQEITGVKYVDQNCIDVDPSDENHIIAAGRTGLYEFQNGTFKKLWNKHNSPLRPAIDKNNELSDAYTLVHGIKFDKNGNLLVLNSQAKDVNLMMLTKEGKWETYTKNELFYKDNIGNTSLKSLIIDSRGLYWFVNSQWNNSTVNCYQPSTDELITYKYFNNQDGINYPFVPNAVSEDLNGNIWVATNMGPFIIKKEEIGQESVTFYQEKVPRNDGTDYADYLLSGIACNCIAIDGAGRKWVATTETGVFLVSEDNMTQINHFTTDNSKLLSNNVLNISINQETGEVFFGTDQGLCSYVSDAIEPAESMDKDHVYAYPNPVDFSNYSGLITVTGLTFNADVKITNAAGFLVAEGRSNGGLFTWDGKDKKGNRVGSGVYHVITATNDGKKGTICRIAVIN